MAKLTIKFNDVVIDQIVLKQGDMNIGRRPGNDIVLDNMAVSGAHASIFTIGEDSFVQDLNSTNGTLVNNKRITKHHLADGDVVTIGNHSLTYINEKAVKATPDLAKTVILSAPKQEDLAAAAKSAAKAGDAPKQASIFILSGTNNGKRIDIVQPITNLGRGGKRAGAISRNGHRYILSPGDEGEKLLLNGVKIGKNGEDLKNGDIIEIGDARMQFYLK